MKQLNPDGGYTPPFFFVPKEEAKKTAGIKSDSTLFHLIRTGGFPRPYKLSHRLIGFKSTDLNEWLLSRQASKLEEVA